MRIHEALRGEGAACEPVNLLSPIRYASSTSQVAEGALLGA